MTDKLANDCKSSASNQITLVVNCVHDQIVAKTLELGNRLPAPVKSAPTPDVEGKADIVRLI
jgi:hypothetical protein